MLGLGMAKTPYPDHTGTIGDRIRLGHDVTIWCENRDCQHRHTLDLGKFAPDMELAALVARAVCSECGARWPQVSVKIAVINAPRVTGG
jgi:hypothetical protein